MNETLNANINYEHPTLREVSSEAVVKEVVFRHPSERIATRLKESLRIFPASLQPKLKDNPPPIAASVLIRKENSPDKKDLGFFFLGGVPGSGAGLAHIVADLFKESSLVGEDTQVNLVAGIGSFASIDTASSHFPANPVERAYYLTALMAQFLETTPCKEIFLLGHSFGGLEATYVAPLLSQYLEESGLDTKLGGMIVVSPAGFFNQNPVEISGPKTQRITSNVDDLRYIYPSLEDIADMKILLAKEEEKGATREDLRARLATMQQRHKNPPYLSPEQEEKLRTLDTKISDEVRPNERVALLKKRQQMLLPIIRDLIPGADMRKGEPPLTMYVEMALKTIFEPWFNASKPGMSRTIPRGIREMSHMPIAIVTSDADGYFSEGEIKYGMIEDSIKASQDLAQRELGLSPQQIYKQTRFFPNASVVDEVSVPGLPHIAGVAVDTKRFGQIVAGLVKKMRVAA